MTRPSTPPPGESVICPVCGASVHHPCLDGRGRIMIDCHVRRVRAEEKKGTTASRPYSSGGNA